MDDKEWRQLSNRKQHRKKEANREKIIFLYWFSELYSKVTKEAKMLLLAMVAISRSLLSFSLCIHNSVRSVEVMHAHKDR